MQFKGTYTAIVTPFSKGKVDFKKLRELVKIQIDAGITGIVPAGTTGESPTLSVEEHLKVIETVINSSDGKCQIIAGTGANSTEEAIYLTREAKKAGADASLQVTPYYNKPTQEGLYRHFLAIAEETKFPIVLYNIPGRCGVPINVETIVRLSKNPNIMAVKEAGGSVERVSAILDACDITVLSGDDALTIPMMAVGASGVISVASNVAPREVREMVDAYLNGNAVFAKVLHMKLFPVFRDLFIETNPIPIKASMAMKGMIEEEYRLPLCPMSEKNRDTLRSAMKKSGII